MTDTTTTTKTSELEYCEKCGTMLIMGTCRRCNPTTKIARPTSIKTPIATKAEVHTMGVDYAVNELAKRGIATTPSTEKGVDLILDNDKTVLIRAMSDELRLAVGVSDLNDLKSDYIIIVSNLEFVSIRGIYVIATEDIKDVAIDRPRRATGISDYFIDRTMYAQHKDNYGILEE